MVLCSEPVGAHGTVGLWQCRRVPAVLVGAYQVAKIGADPKPPSNGFCVGPRWRQRSAACSCDHLNLHSLDVSGGDRREPFLENLRQPNKCLTAGPLREVGNRADPIEIFRKRLPALFAVKNQLGVAILERRTTSAESVI